MTSLTSHDVPQDTTGHLLYHPSSRCTMIGYVQYRKAQYYKEFKGENVPYDNEQTINTQK